MANTLLELDDISMPALLRHARTTYSEAMRKSLDKAGYEDIPKNGLYVLGGLTRQKAGRPLSELIEDLRISKQAAGQLVDMLVTRGYLDREVDTEDRRKLTIVLTDRGRAAAKVQAAARAAVDAELISRVGSKNVDQMRRTLSVLIESRLNTRAKLQYDGKGAAMQLNNVRETLSVRNADITESCFSNAKLMKSSFDDVNLKKSAFTNVDLSEATFVDVNLSNASIKDANLTGMKINDVLVSDLILAYENRVK